MDFDKVKFISGIKRDAPKTVARDEIETIMILLILLLRISLNQWFSTFLVGYPQNKIIDNLATHLSLS
jgi:hypothetical protein